MVVMGEAVAIMNFINLLTFFYIDIISLYFEAYLDL